MNPYHMDWSSLTKPASSCPTCGQATPIHKLFMIHDDSGHATFVQCHACTRKQYADVIRAKAHMLALLRLVREPVDVREVDAVCQAAQRFLEGA